MKEVTTNSGKTYSVHTMKGCTIIAPDGWQKTIEAPDGYFDAHFGSVVIEGDDEASIKELFKLAPYQKLRLLGVVGGNDGLPKGYTRLAYLESTGSQYINTKYYLEKADDYVMVDVAEVRRPQYWGAVWGISKDNEPSYNLGLKYYTDNTKFRVFYGDKYTYGFWEQLGTIPSNRNLYVNDGGQWSCNGISVGTLYPADFKCTAPASLFCIYNGTNPSWSRSALKVFGFEIRRAGEPTLNFIPALDPTGTPCMFDTVTRKPFYNSGTGDFIYPGKETESTTYSLRNRMYAQYSEHGIRRLYRVPAGYEGSKEEYAAEHGFKILVETPLPEEGYWAPVWHDREDCIELEWVETEPTMEEETLTETE